jgi:hypothetical protein
MQTLQLFTTTLKQKLFTEGLKNANQEGLGWKILIKFYQKTGWSESAWSEVKELVN